MALSPRSRSTALLCAATLIGAALGAQGPLTSMAELTHTDTLAGNVMTTRSACTAGIGYADAVQTLNPSFYWRMGESAPPAVTSVQDATPNDVDGTVRGAGLTFGASAPGLIECEDTFGVDFPGGAASSDFIVQQNPSPNADTFTISAWIRTNTTDGGWVLGMGSSRWGPSINRDRVIYLQAERPASVLRRDHPKDRPRGSSSNQRQRATPAGGYVERVRDVALRRWTASGNRPQRYRRRLIHRQ